MKTLWKKKGFVDEEFLSYISDEEKIAFPWSMIDKITPTEVINRLPGTLAIHLESIRNGASIIRCHDVKEHFQAIKVFEAIENIN